MQGLFEKFRTLRQDLQAAEESAFVNKRVAKLALKSLQKIALGDSAPEAPASEQSDAPAASDSNSAQRQQQSQEQLSQQQQTQTQTQEQQQKPEGTLQQIFQGLQELLRGEEGQEEGEGAHTLKDEWARRVREWLEEFKAYSSGGGAAQAANVSPGPELQPIKRIKSNRQRRPNRQSYVVGHGGLTDEQLREIADDVSEGLNEEQLRQFDREGFLLIEDILNNKERMEGISEIWDVLETVPASVMTSTTEQVGGEEGAALESDSHQQHRSQSDMKSATQENTSFLANPEQEMESTQIEGYLKKWLQCDSNPQLQDNATHFYPPTRLAEPCQAAARECTPPPSPKHSYQISYEQLPWTKYGIVNEPRAYHTKTHWKLRQNIFLYSIYCQLFGTQNLQTSIERASILLPTQLESENHQHMGYFEDAERFQSGDDGSAAGGSGSGSSSQKPVDVSQKVHGVVNLTERTINLVPGSNCEQWQQAYQQAYGESDNASQFSDDHDDPWDLGQVLPYEKRRDGTFLQKSKTNYGCTRSITCPPGSILIFHQRTMHTLSRNDTNKIAYGLFVSFFPSMDKNWLDVYDRQEWELKNPQCVLDKLAFKATLADERILAERIRAYLSGSLSEYRMALPPQAAGLTLYTSTSSVTLRKAESQLDSDPLGGAPNRRRGKGRRWRQSTRAQQLPELPPPPEAATEQQQQPMEGETKARKEDEVEEEEQEQEQEEEGGKQKAAEQQG